MPKVKEIVEQVLKDLKAEITSASDIISRIDLPYLVPDEYPENIKRFGAIKFAHYLSHREQTEKVRNKARALLPLYQLKKIPSPITTLHVAVTQTGFGECGETSHRAALELVIKLKAAGLKAPVALLGTFGKPRVLFPRGLADYYEHIFVIVGKTPRNWPVKNGLQAFRELSDECIVLDPSIGIIGKARDTERLLKGIFDAYGINRIEAVDEMTPEEHGDLARIILENAKQISDAIKRTLKLGEKPQTSEKCVSYTTLADMLIAAIKSSSRNKLFDINQKHKPKISMALDNEESIAGSRYSLFNPSSVLCSSEVSNDWAKSERLYEITKHQGDDYIADARTVVRCGKA